ncbi:hypothetical protein Pint_21228 [Pistacia integerrima]|uniref:Uncharacterized protein n=1 Tax=Pistacia integerrima TaxID=434235 RepID=A0ACC0X9W7_9ROSI|nr:hypothetical protein Pint_21228 [Pistacia integerrima]
MASSSSLSASASYFSALSKPPSAFLHYHHSATLSFPFSAKPTWLRLRLRLSNKGTPKYSTVAKGQLNEVSFFESFSLEDLFSNFRSFLDTLLGSPVAFKVAVAGSSNVPVTSSTESEVPGAEAKDAKPSKEPSPATLATEESISEFINQVSSLVKLVDSRDIVELQLKQLDCELIIRKKEALLQPALPAPTVMMHAPTPPPVMPTAPPAPAPTPSASAPSPAASSSPAPAAKSAKFSLPSLKCPMAGTFYRSPAPGEPPFVKVGDKVQKGQVLCIIEAMKLMNEIEADQSGTIVEVVAEDGKSVSIDTPLFVIEP